MTWKIGEIVQRTGLTARTLHFYEEVGLIGPIARNTSGHRLYKRTDLFRLQQICSLRSLGIPLADMPKLLEDDRAQLTSQLRQQLQRLKSQRKAIEEFEERIFQLLDKLEADSISSHSLDETLFQTLESFTMYEKYFSQQEIQDIHDFSHGDDNESSVETAWNQWVEKMQLAIRSGASPKSEEVQALMSHWGEMLNHISGDNKSRIEIFNELLHKEPQARKEHGIDDGLFEFMAKAIEGHE